MLTHCSGSPCNSGNGRRNPRSSGRDTPGRIAPSGARYECLLGKNLLWLDDRWIKGGDGRIPPVCESHPQSRLANVQELLRHLADKVAHKVADTVADKVADKVGRRCCHTRAQGNAPDQLCRLHMTYHTHIYCRSAEPVTGPQTVVPQVREKKETTRTAGFEPAREDHN